MADHYLAFFKAITNSFTDHHFTNIILGERAVHGQLTRTAAQIADIFRYFFELYPYARVSSTRLLHLDWLDP
jgi:hypothetical protein